MSAGAVTGFATVKSWRRIVVVMFAAPAAGVARTVVIIHDMRLPPTADRGDQPGLFVVDGDVVGGNHDIHHTSPTPTATISTIMNVENGSCPCDRSQFGSSSQMRVTVPPRVRVRPARNGGCGQGAEQGTPNAPHVAHRDGSTSIRSHRHARSSSREHHQQLKPQVVQKHERDSGRSHQRKPLPSGQLHEPLGLSRHAHHMPRTGNESQGKVVHNPRIRTHPHNVKSELCKATNPTSLRNTRSEHNFRRMT